MKTYGILSDIHAVSPFYVERGIENLIKKGAESLVFNGDLVGEGFEDRSSQDYLALILDKAGKSGLETYVQPGSHEELKDYLPVTSHFSEKYENIFDSTKNQKFEFGDHELVFLPGSDFRASGEFALESRGEIESGIYGGGFGEERVFISNIDNLKKLVTSPEKTVVFCHVPRKFDDVNNCVDYAFFGKDKEGNVFPGVVIENYLLNKFKNEMSCENIMSNISELGEEIGISLKQENRGNKYLKKSFEEVGISKSVSGHFHESVHRANDSKSKSVEEGEFVNELFWMASYVDGGKAGLLSVDGEKVKYENVFLE